MAQTSLAGYESAVRKLKALEARRAGRKYVQPMRPVMAGDVSDAAVKIAGSELAPIAVLLGLTEKLLDALRRNPDQCGHKILAAEVKAAKLAGRAYQDVAPPVPVAMPQEPAASEPADDDTWKVTLADDDGPTTEELAAAREKVLRRARKAHKPVKASRPEVPPAVVRSMECRESQVREALQTAPVAVPAGLPAAVRESMECREANREALRRAVPAGLDDDAAGDDTVAMTYRPLPAKASRPVKPATPQPQPQPQPQPASRPRRIYRERPAQWHLADIM